MRLFVSLLLLHLFAACATTPSKQEPLNAPQKASALSKKPAPKKAHTPDSKAAPKTNLVQAPAENLSKPLDDKTPSPTQNEAPPEPSDGADEVVVENKSEPKEWVVVSKERGIASYYHDGLIGNLTANGERYRANKKTCAHKKLPFGTVVDVVDLDTNKSVRCRINDRGPFVKGRIIDLSKVLARELGLMERGITRVEVRRLKRNKSAD